jgi:hypothetical protein
MKRNLSSVLVIAILMLCVAAEEQAAPPVFKEKKYFGPIPYNTLGFAIGFLDGPTAEYLIEHLDHWANERAGFDAWENFRISPFARFGYERQITPKHFLKTSVAVARLEAISIGEYIGQITIPSPTPNYPDTTINAPLVIERTFRTYLVAAEIGFTYYFFAPEVRHTSPFLGAGFAAVFPFEELETDTWWQGQPIDNRGENVSEKSMEAGLHLEFGVVYYLTNRYSAAVEGRYQMTQSKFRHHKANFDIRYSGFTLTLNVNYHF